MWTGVIDGARQPSTVTCVGVKEQIDQRARDNRKVTFDGITCEVNISHGN